MNVAVIGCGYVADFYAKTLGNYPQLTLIGAFDRNSANLRGFCRHWSVRDYNSLDELLQDPAVEVVLNLTNPRSHYEVTRRSIGAGKHVYSEKPLAMSGSQAWELVRLAEEQKVSVAVAPCSLLGETAQTVWKALSEGVIGRVRLVYANFDDGMIAPRQSPWLWQNDYGAPWPAKDEFEVGCTFEHAAYVLTWLAAFFGPARQVTAFASCLLPDKGIEVDAMAPDFTSGCIEYPDDVVARITCSLVAPKDKSLTIIGDDGVLRVEDVRNDVCPIYVKPTKADEDSTVFERGVDRLRRLLHHSGCERELGGWRRYPIERRPPGRFVSRTKQVDFCRGLAELADAVRQQRSCRLSAHLGFHIVELIESLQYPERFGFRRKFTSTFDPIELLP